jgi:hypothetical protein
MDSKARNAKQVYQRSLSRGLILKPKQETLEKHELTEFWDQIKALKYKPLQFRSRKSFLLQVASKSETPSSSSVPES